LFLANAFGAFDAFQYHLELLVLSGRIQPFQFVEFGNVRNASDDRRPFLGLG
jgi:hypothetical protein